MISNEEPQGAARTAAAICDALADEIFAGVLRPGELLRQEMLARRFGVSRIPVRDALLMLERKGLVEPAGRRGMRVRPVSRKAIQDLYEFREALEAFCFRKACVHMCDRDFEALREMIRFQRDAIARGDMEAFIESDQQFHLYICDSADNGALRDALGNVWARINQVRSIVRRDPVWGSRWAARSVQRHEAILAALQARDPVRAILVNETILRQAAFELAEKLEQAGYLAPEDPNDQAED